MGLKNKIAAAHARVNEAARLIEMNANDLVQSKKIIEAGRRSRTGRAPNGSIQVHNKFVADQKERIQEHTEAKEELCRLEAEADGLDSDTSSALSSIEDETGDEGGLPGIDHTSRGMNATPAPSSQGFLEEDDKDEGLDINTPDVDMTDATREPFTAAELMAGVIVLQKARDESDVEMHDGTCTTTEGEGIEASVIGSEEKERALVGDETALREKDEIQEVLVVPGVDEQKEMPPTKPSDAHVEIPARHAIEAGMKVNREGEATALAQPVGKGKGEAFVGDGITGHDSELFKMDLEEDGDGLVEPVKDLVPAGKKTIKLSTGGIKKVSKKKKSTKVTKTKESGLKELGEDETKGKDGDACINEDLQGKEEEGPMVTTIAQDEEGAVKKVSKKKKSKKVESDNEDEDGEGHTEAELQKLEEDGRAAIIAFMQDGDKIAHTIRNLARSHRDFLPESATTSRTVALHILSTSDTQCICLYHKHSNKDYKARDKKPPVQGFWLSGVTGEVRKGNDERPPSTGHLNCGCSIEAALAYFLWWKKWTLRGLDGKVEPMSKVQFNPCARNLVLQQIQQLTGITVANMYPEDGDHYDSLEHQKNLIHVQLKHVLERLKRVNLGLGTDEYTTKDALIFVEATRGIFTSRVLDSVSE